MYQGENLILILSPPRCGSTMLQRILGSHSEVLTHPEPHVLTPLAFQGYYYKVDKAGYNHKVAAEAFREFVDFLPRKEEDYLDACRAYCEVLYSRALADSGKRYFLDKSPNYADTILPFVARLLPKARFIVLTRHPLAVMSSVAHTFYDGDYGRAYYSRDVLGTFIPPIARFMRESGVEFIHIRYEDLVSQPEEHVRRLLAYLDLEFQQECIRFGEKQHITKTYGDPKIGRHKQPVTDYIHSWVEDMIYHNDRKQLCERILRGIAREDLITYGYPPEEIWKPMQEAIATHSFHQAQRPDMTMRLSAVKWGLVRSAQSLARRPMFAALLRKVSNYSEALLK